MKRTRPKVSKVQMPDPFPSMWVVAYQHPVHGVLIRPCPSHAEAIANADRIARKP